jgi:SMC interacting uncharacterized protein involved in chromosome segregation
MTINIKETLEEIGRLERLQAQVELRSAQIKEDERKLREKLKAQGVAPAELEQKIKELEAIISSKLTLIRSLDKAVGGTSGGEEINI